MSKASDGAFPVKARRYSHHLRTALSLTVVVLLTLGLATLALADPPTGAEKAPGHGHDHGKAAPGHGHDHGKAGHGHGDGDGHSHGASHSHAKCEPACGFGSICSHGICTPVIDNWVKLTGFGKDKEIKNGPILIAILNFALLIFLLWYFARKPIGGYLANRHETIKSDLVEAAELREQAREKLNEIEGKLKFLNDEVEEIKKGVAKDAEFERAKIIEAANLEADRIIANAEASLDREIRRARRKLESEAIDGALRVAEQLVREKLGDADRKRINENFISQITSSGGSN